MSPIAPASRPYRAVCFDLDGTLLPMDLHEFLSGYYKALAAFAVAHGCNAVEVSKALDAGINAVLKSEDGRTNHDVFWEAFCRNMGGEESSWEALFNQFYEEEFGRLGANVVPNPAAARAIAALQAKGYPLVLTTMPLFPHRAVEWRLQWAGVPPEAFQRLTVYSNSTSVKPKLAYYQENLDAMGLSGEDVEWRLQWAGVPPEAFQRLTVYSNSTSVKPKLAYYQENLDAMGLSGEDVLMVGNNTVEDLAFTQLGADAFLVTDWLLNPSGMDVDEVRHGTMEQFAQWVETLPPCANPATSIQP